MSDLVERLRKAVDPEGPKSYWQSLLREAADEIERLDGKRLDAFALAETTFYDMEGLKHGVRKFFDVIKTNIVDSPVFPEDMRFMAKMLLANQGALASRLESETPKQIQGRQVIAEGEKALASDDASKETPE